MGRCVVSDDLVHHGGMMHCSGGVKEGGTGAGGDDGGRRGPTAATGPHSRLLSIATTINKHKMRQDYVVKTRKCYNY